jgi:hypothetical protein
LSERNALFCRIGPYSRLQDRSLKNRLVSIVLGSLLTRQTIDAGRSDLDLLETGHSDPDTLYVWCNNITQPDRPGSRRMSTQWQAFSKCPQVNGCRSDQLRCLSPRDVVQVRPNGLQIPARDVLGVPTQRFLRDLVSYWLLKPWGDTSPCSKSNLTWTRKTL